MSIVACWGDDSAICFMPLTPRLWQAMPVGCSTTSGVCAEVLGSHMGGGRGEVESTGPGPASRFKGVQCKANCPIN